MYALTKIFREVHLSDLRRADEGNPESKAGESSKINWAKYDMIGQFIAYLTTIQERCTANDGYRLTENIYIGQLLDVSVMDYDVRIRNFISRREDTDD